MHRERAGLPRSPVGSDPLPSSPLPRAVVAVPGPRCLALPKAGGVVGNGGGVWFGCPGVVRSGGMAPRGRPAWISSPLEGQVSSGQGVCE